MSVKVYTSNVKENRLTVTAAAAILGVHRVYLSSVIHGHRKSRSLMRRYRALKRQQKSRMDGNNPPA